MKIWLSSLVLFFTIFCCNTSSISQTNMLPAFDKQGHRGCRGLMPENTIAAMIKAIDLGVTTLEMDIVFTKDSQAILSHEPFFNHDITTLPNGAMIPAEKEKAYNIFNMTYSETLGFDVGKKTHPRFARQQKMAAVKPLLKDVIIATEQYIRSKKLTSVYYNIETKTQPLTDNIYHPAPQLFVEMLMKIINEQGIGEKVIIQSFDVRTLQVLHKNYPAIKTALLIEDFDKRTLPAQLTTLGFTPTIYSPAAVLVTPSLVKECHRKQLKIIPWTVNTKAAINSLKDMKVDGIITDYPDLFND